MTRFVCPDCGSRIHFLDEVAICLNPTCSIGRTLTRNRPKEANEQPQTQVDSDQHRAKQSPVRGDEADSGGGKPRLLPPTGTGGDQTVLNGDVCRSK